MLRINYIRNNQLNFKSITHLDQKEANEILTQLNISSNIKPKQKEQNYILRSPHLIKIDNQEYNYNTKEAKIMNEVKLPLQINDKNYYGVNNYERDNVVNYEKQDKHKEQYTDRKKSWINQFRNDNFDDNNKLRDQICRISYEKIALQGHYNTLLDQNLKKDELINQLRLELDIKSNPNQGNILFNIPNNTISHHQNQNKTISNNNIQHYSIQSSQVTQNQHQNNQWGPIHQNKTFQQINTNITNYRSNY